MKKISIVWAVATPIIFLLAIPFARAADQSYLICVVALYGFLFLFTAWTQGKGMNAFAANAGSPGGAKIRDLGGRSDPPAEPVLEAERRRMVFLVKKPRSAGDITTIGSSWMGGMPALGATPWPRDSTGRPMHHLVQIDLADAAPKLGVVGLPATGSLAFFTAAGVDEEGEFETAVVYVGQAAGQTAPPIDLQSVGDHTYGGPWSKGADADTLLAFPRWAVDLIPHATRGESYDIEPLIAEKTDGRFLRDSMQYLANGFEPSYWDSAQRLARSFEAALDSDRVMENHERSAARWEADLATFAADGVRPGADPEAMQQSIDATRGKVARMRAVRPELQRKAQNMRTWAFAHDPWEPLAADDLARLKEWFAPFSFQAKDSDEQLFYRYSGYGVNTLEDLARETFRAMVTGPDAVYGLLPDAVGDNLDANGLWNNPAHQMFGPGIDIQTAASDNMHNHLLMQIASDRLLGMGWGDAGAIQFWISPNDLATQSWSNAFATFDSH